MKDVVIENRKATYDYFIIDTLECGIELRGNEVKSIRKGKASIKKAWISIENSEMFIKGMHINPWETSNIYDISEKRDKRLLAHKQEIHSLFGKVKQDGFTLIPLKVYFIKGKCKVLVGLCKGKKNYDKRATEKEKAMKMEIRKEAKVHI